MPAEPPLAIVGPTASGKTEAALAIAEALGAEIVSVDSATIYRAMNVGTAKPTPGERARVPHHLLDVADPDDTFTVARYQALARSAIDGIRARGHRVLLVGGSGLYLRAIVDDLVFPPTDATTRSELEAEAALVGAVAMHERLRTLDPTAAGRIEPDNVRRTVRALEVAGVTGRAFSEFSTGWDAYPPGRVRAAGIELPRAILAERIERRVRDQIEHGFVREVRSLEHAGYTSSLTARQVIGYAEVSLHLAGELSIEEVVRLTVKRTKALARRQMAWFRRDPRIRWFRAGPDGAAGVADEILEHLRG